MPDFVLERIMPIRKNDNEWHAMKGPMSIFRENIFQTVRQLKKNPQKYTCIMMHVYDTEH